MATNIREAIERLAEKSVANRTLFFADVKKTSKDHQAELIKSQAKTVAMRNIAYAEREPNVGQVLIDAALPEKYKNYIRLIYQGIEVVEVVCELVRDIKKTVKQKNPLETRMEPPVDPTTPPSVPVEDSPEVVLSDLSEAIDNIEKEVEQAEDTQPTPQRKRRPVERGRA